MCANKNFEILVQSNDQLYDSDDEYLQEIDKLAGLIVEEILIEIKEFGSNEQFKKQAFLAFELFLRIVFHADLEDLDGSLIKLGAKLWSFCVKYQFNEKLQVGFFFSLVVQYASEKGEFQIIILINKSLEMVSF